MDDRQTDALRLDNQMCFPLYAAAREVTKRYRPFLDALNLTYTQYITMMVLWERQACSVKELGDRLYLDSGTLTPVVKNLEQKGFVRRYRSKEDERVLLVELTGAGQSLRDEAQDLPRQICACIALTPEEIVTLRSLLKKLLPAEEN